LLFFYFQHIIYARLGNLKPEMDAILKDLKKETDRAVIMYKWDAKKAKLAFHVSVLHCHISTEIFIFSLYWSLPCTGQETVESTYSEGQLPSIQSHSPTLGSDSSLGLHVSSTQKHGHDASCTDHWYFYTVSPFKQFFPNQILDAQILYLSLSTGGFGWIPNLTEVDHSLILPVFMALTNLAIIQIQVMSKVGPSSRLSNAMMNVLRVFCLVMVPVAAFAPAVRLILV
jgi:inner membrane protein COX18